MKTPLSLHALSGVWSKAIARDEPTIAFEVTNGLGRFLFMMFFDLEDKTTKDRLFVFLLQLDGKSGPPFDEAFLSAH